MNLQETIDALDKQAARYTEAADALRALLGQEDSPDVAPSETEPEAVVEEESAEKVVEEATPAPRRRGRKPGPKPKAGSKTRKGRGNRGPVSAETRAKISEALRASHAERRALAEQAGAAE